MSSKNKNGFWVCRRFNIATLVVPVFALVCSCQRPVTHEVPVSPNEEGVGNGGNTEEGQLDVISAELGSEDWNKRLDTIGRLAAFGVSAQNSILPALADKNDAVRKAAQFYFIDSGEEAVPFLVQKLIDAETDVGFYARIAGGVERHEVKSLAGTLWLALARGTDRDRCFEITQRLISHDSKKIRAVGLFTAATMREARFIKLIEPIADDEDPMIKDRYFEALVLLLVKRSASAPDLDADATEQTLRLLGPELVPLLNSEKRGAVYTWKTYGDLLSGAGVHEDFRQRFIDMLLEAIKDNGLTQGGAVRAGAVIARQYKKDDPSAAFGKWVKALGLNKTGTHVYKQLAALSSFPPDAYRLETLPTLLKSAESLASKNPAQSRGFPMLAANYLLKALAEGDKRAAKRAGTFLLRWLGSADPNLSKDAAFGVGRVLAKIDKDTALSADGARALHGAQRRRLKAAASKHTDKLFERATSLSLQEIFELEKLFYLLDDPRYFQLFEMVWSHRWDDKPGLHTLTTRAILFLADHRDKAVLPHILECAESKGSRWHNKLRDGCAYGLTQTRRFAPLVGEYLTDERLARWIQIIEDPNLYSRTRAGFFPILKEPSLAPEKRKALADLTLKYTTPPHDSNLRSKAVLSLSNAGDMRALKPLYAMVMETDHPWWIFENLVSALAKLHGAPRFEWGPGNPAGLVPKKAVSALIELLEAQLTTMKPFDDVRFAYPNNYFSWGIEYLTYPPEHTLYFLKKFTRNDFGMDVMKWRAWLAEQEDILSH